MVNSTSPNDSTGFGAENAAGYLRDPRLTFFRFDWRCFVLLRFGLLMMKVPLPTYSALYSLSSFVVSNVDVVSANVYRSVQDELNLNLQCTLRTALRGMGISSRCFAA